MKKYQVKATIIDKRNNEEYTQNIWCDSTRDGLFIAENHEQACKLAMEDWKTCVNRDNYDDWAEIENGQVVMYGGADYVTYILKDFVAVEA